MMKTKLHNQHNLRKEAHIVIAMSGGVDSSVVATVLKNKGHNCSGLFMKSWAEDKANKSECTWEKDVEDALSVCEKIGIPLNTVDLTKEYWSNVFQKFLSDYSVGKTPNPDVLCNKKIKFDAFKIAAKELGADYIATGHYAKIQNKNGQIELLKAEDKKKDQTYFLHTLTQGQLSKVLFPIGGMTKSEVRAIAKSHGLENSEKKDSTGICFIGKRPFQQFLSKYLPSTPGMILDDEGNKIGEHPGAVYFTIGQRKGLNLGGLIGKSSLPWFVASKNVKNNIVTVVQGRNHPALFSSNLLASDFHWIPDIKPVFPFTCTAKVRYQQDEQICEIRKKAGDRLIRVNFKEPQWAITPGQSIVFYKGSLCLGGAVIEDKEKI